MRPLAGALRATLGRLELRMPVCGVESFIDFHPARSPEAQTLVVYHHGLKETPHDGSARLILGDRALRDRIDWVAIKEPHHDAAANVFGRLLASERSFADALFSSVFAARAVAAYFRPHYRHIILAGMSMGGVIALVEQTIGFVFDLALPIMAGPHLASVLLRSSFARVVSPEYRRRCERMGDLAERLDVAGYIARREGPPIRAVLARDDRLFLFEA